MPEKILKKESYIAQEDIHGFYGSKISAGTVLYPSNKADKGIFHNFAWSYRFVFDTMKGATAHDLPKGNVRCAIWYTKGQFENSIK
jgi:hypothetical protein